jgi:hypothetical protein
MKRIICESELLVGKLWGKIGYLALIIAKNVHLSNGNQIFLKLKTTLFSFPGVVQQIFKLELFSNVLKNGDKQ